MSRPLNERTKVDKYLTKVQTTNLMVSKAQLRYNLLNTDAITFTVAANHLNSEVSP